MFPIESKLLDIDKIVLKKLRHSTGQWSNVSSLRDDFGYVDLAMKI